MSTTLLEAKESGGWVGVEVELSRRMDRLGFSEWERDLYDLMAEMRVLARSQVVREGETLALAEEWGRRDAERIRDMRRD